MDKSLIDLPTRMSRNYLNGIDRFLEFVYTDRLDEIVKDHLYSNGFCKKYENWSNHGESYVSFHENVDIETLVDLNVGDDMVGMINDTLRNPHVSTSVENDYQTAHDPRTGANEETSKYFKLLEDAQSALYPSYKKFTLLSFVIRLLHMKVLNK
ncbi:hypothetical protein ACSBR2_017607 [Camellia fascicularis]